MSNGPGEDDGDYLLLQHRLLKLALGTNHLAPLQAPQAMLDIGCGNGIWVVEMAQEFPGTMVTGIDIDPQAFEKTRTRLEALQQLPPNVQFIEADALQRFPFADSSFDYSHLRLISGAVPPDRWPSLLAEMVRVTRPGGTVEILDVLDMPRSQSPHFTALINANKLLLTRLDKPIGVISGLPALLQQMRVTAIKEHQFLIGTGEIPGEQKSLQETAFATLQATEPFIAQLAILPLQQYQAMLEQAHLELASGRDLIWPLIAVHGRRL